MYDFAETLKKNFFLSYLEKERRVGNFLSGHVDVHGEGPHFKRCERNVEEAILLFQSENNSNQKCCNTYL